MTRLRITNGVGVVENRHGWKDIETFVVDFAHKVFGVYFECGKMTKVGNKEYCGCYKSLFFPHLDSDHT